MNTARTSATPTDNGPVAVTLRNRVTAPDLVGALAHDLLTALGHPAYRDSDTTTGRCVPVLPAYLAAHHTTHVVIGGAERLHHLTGGTAERARGDITDLLHRGGVTEVTFRDGPAPAQPHHPATVGGSDVTDPTHPDTSGRDTSPFPPVPGDEALTFLTSVDELLDPADAARVRTVVHAAADHTDAECVPYLPTGPRHQPGLVPHPWVTHYVRTRLEATHDVDNAVAVVRGIQLALFHAGWWLTVDIDDFVNTYLAAPPPALGDSTAWVSLMTYRTPLIGCMTALAAAGVSKAGLEHVTPGHVADDYTWVREGWRRHPLPAPARFYIETQVHLLGTTAPVGVDPRILPLASLLDRHGRPVRATSAQVGAALRAPKDDLGVVLTGRPRDWAHRNEYAWARRWHLDLHPISAAARAACKTTSWRAA